MAKGTQLKSFEAIVGVPLEKTPEKETAVARATRHLSSHSERFAHDADVWDVHVYGGVQDSWAIALHFDITCDSDDDMKQLMDSFVETPGVETVEEVG